MKTRPCPVCGEEIAVAAKKCRFCNEVFDVEGLKQLQQANAGGIDMPMPTSLSIMTCLQYVGYSILIFASFAGLLAGNAVGMIGVALFGAAFFLVAKVRSRSATAWRIMAGLQLLGTFGSLASPVQLVINGIFLAVLFSKDVRDYCSL